MGLDDEEEKVVPRQRIVGRSTTLPAQDMVKSATIGEASVGRRLSHRRDFRRRHSLCHVPCGDLHQGHVMDLTDLRPVLRRRPSTLRELAPTPQTIHRLLKRAQTRVDLTVIEDSEEDASGEDGKKQAEGGYIVQAALAVLLNVLSVVPYVKILATDPGSPLCIAFVTHLFVVAVNLPKAKDLILNRKLPIHYHAAMVALAYLFNVLKSDSFARLPTAVAMVMMNLQMLIGMMVQGLIFRQTFSLPQISGCVIVTFGVVIAGLSAKKPSASSSASDAAAGASADLLLGVVELLGGLTAIVFLSKLTKVAFFKFGECVDEQIFFQHLFATPLFFIGSQWEQIGPRFYQWIAGGDILLAGFLISNLAFTFAGSKARVTFVGRAPNGLLVQLIETLTKFIQLFTTALLNSPPLPPTQFWAGSGVLLLGTLQFLSASDAPGNATSNSDDEEGEEGKATE